MKAVTKNTWELVVGGSVPEIKAYVPPDARAKYKRAARDKQRYLRVKENSLND
tara:strand:+ start:508 stop:666 length:159 start_codon:yes stop_codon:yes gene_type:complete